MPLLSSHAKIAILVHEEIIKGNGGYFFTFYPEREGGGLMTLYDVLGLLIIATGFIIAINKK